MVSGGMGYIVLLDVAGLPGIGGIRGIGMIRVFPRKTKASPNDSKAYFGPPDMFVEDRDIHISCAFTWDIPYAETLYHQWKPYGYVKIGGPAFGVESDEFVPGRYLKHGYTITSRGCPNRCWFCSVWRREPRLKELKINDGWNVLDDNLLACSDNHIANVFTMLQRQPKPIEFTGGLEANRLKDWHVELLTTIRLGQAFFAYDTEDDFDPLVYAARSLSVAGLMVNHKMRCYVLIGYKGDSFEKAEGRLLRTLNLGYFPMAMLYTENGKYDLEWRRFQREWVRPAIINARLRHENSGINTRKGRVGEGAQQEHPEVGEVPVDGMVHTGREGSG
jgi:hypothetical protein